MKGLAVSISGRREPVRVPLGRRRRIGISRLQARLQACAELRGVEQRQAGVHDLEEDLHEVECKSACDALAHQPALHTGDT